MPHEIKTSQIEITSSDELKIVMLKYMREQNITRYGVAKMLDMKLGTLTNFMADHNQCPKEIAEFFGFTKESPIYIKKDPK